MSNPPITTRFAPSPTGSLHVGGARTALFSWAYARHHAAEGAQFILRIEDTDQARSTEASTAGILRDLHWLGLEWDQGPQLQGDHVVEKGDRGPYFQSQRLDRYAEQIQRLLDAGRAYKCFKTAEQLDAERQQARQEKRAYKYDPTESLALTEAQCKAYEAKGMPYVIRFRMPTEDLVVHDEVLGEVRFPIDQQDDFVIQKASTADVPGFPTFHLAVVVDDAAMGVTHVIRGQEHLNNTAKHVALQDALGFDRPHYAHIPLIFNADGSKMSKRDKAKVARAEAKAQGLQSVGFDDERYQAFLNKKNDDMDIAAAIAEKLGLTLPEIDVDDFRRSGYLPQVLCNYLALLGWSPGENVERFGDDPLTFIREKFSLDRVGKSNARFDREKLFRFNAEAIVAMDPAAFRQQVYALNAGMLAEHFEGPDDPKFAMFCDAYQERSRTLVEPIENGQFFFVADDAIAYDEKAVQKVLHKNEGDGLKVLEELKAKFEQVPPDDWSAEPLHELVKQHAEETGRGMGKVAQPIRVAVSGNTVSPPIDQTLVILGRDAVVRRIERCLHECVMTT
ncbi:MAG: glutamate--tRNA ligase [Phycisphaeraceae bacterium]